jgi:hypothetical protein
MVGVLSRDVQYQLAGAISITWSIGLTTAPPASKTASHYAAATIDSCTIPTGESR